MLIGYDLKDIQKIIYDKYPDSRVVVRSQTQYAPSDSGAFPQTVITLELIIYPIKKLTVGQHILKFLKRVKCL